MENGCAPQNRLMLQEHKELAEDTMVASQDPMRTQTWTRDGEQSGDTTRTETQTQTQNQNGSGSGNGNREDKGQ